VHSLSILLGSASLALVVGASSCRATRDAPSAVAAPAPAPALKPALKRLGILLFPGVKVIDFAGS
jgi:hypothetical protein